MSEGRQHVVERTNAGKQCILWRVYRTCSLRSYSKVYRFLVIYGHSVSPDYFKLTAARSWSKLGQSICSNGGGILTCQHASKSKDLPFVIVRHLPVSPDNFKASTSLVGRTRAVCIIPPGVAVEPANHFPTAKFHPSLY